MKNNGIRSCIVEEPYTSAATPSRISLLSRNSETLHCSAFQCSAGVRNPQMVQNVRIPKMQSLLLCMLYFIKMYSRSTCRWNRWRVVKKRTCDWWCTDPRKKQTRFTLSQRILQACTNILQRPLQYKFWCILRSQKAFSKKGSFEYVSTSKLSRKIMKNIYGRHSWLCQAAAQAHRFAIASLVHISKLFLTNCSRHALRPRSSSVNCSRSQNRPKGAELWCSSLHNEWKSSDTKLRSVCSRLRNCLW